MHTPPLDRDQLIAALHASSKPRERWLVGAEFERHLLRPDGLPLPYHGDVGVRSLMERLEREGWAPYREGEFPISMSRDNAQITLEPGGQFELSGAPFRSVREVHAEVTAAAAEVDAALDGVARQVALGFTPYAHIADVPWVPKGRYAVMGPYLATTGPLAHDMMKGTAAVQATYDFSDESDCAAKVGLATHIGPLTTAMFANSPYKEGKFSGFMSWRGHAWTQTDDRRTGFPEAAEGFTFEKWVDYLLDVPMMFTKNRATGGWLPANGRTFADWMSDPVRPPTIDDWVLHMTSVFPEVRVKSTIEIRGADCVPIPLAMSFVALFFGLFSDERALADGLVLAESFGRNGHKVGRFEIACRDGLQGVVGGRRMADWAADLLAVADLGLQRKCPSDRHFLGPLSELVAAGESPARRLLARLGDAPAPAELLAATSWAG